MKLILVVVAIAAVATASYLPIKKREADKDFLMKEKTILQLLQHVQQLSMIPDHMEIAKTYKMEDNMDKYNNMELVQEFLKMYQSKMMLPRGEIFTVMNKQHLQQAIKMFNCMYFAKDWDTFYRTAAWARNNVNEGMFVYALTVAVMHREDTRTLILPPPYEVYPHLFVKNQVIQKAYEAKMKGNKMENKKMIVIEDKPTMNEYDNKEMRLSYFTEDIGLNTYNMYYHLEYPFWMKSDMYRVKFDRRGELFWYTHKQLMNRYMIERMVNNLNEFEQFDMMNQQTMTGYNPNLRYKNGQDMPVRPADMKFRNADMMGMELVQDFERRIRDAIDLGMVMDFEGKKMSIKDEHGMDVLGRMIEYTMDNVNPSYYGTLYNTLLRLVGHIVDPLNKQQVAPSAMEHFETMLRDPMYYRLFARINRLFMRYKMNMPYYTRDQLTFPGVKVENMDVDKLVTYFDQYDVEITNAVDMGSMDDDDMEIRARQYRLNHKPFSMKMDITTDKETSAMIRVFLTPKYNMNGMEMTMKQQQKYMIEMDKFPIKLQNGKNTIERKSFDMTSTRSDMMSYRMLMKKVEDALQGRSTMYIEDSMRHCGYPDRLLLPKGQTYGQKYTMVVMVTPMEDKEFDKMNWNSMLMCGAMQNQMYPDKYSMGYPFDREMKETEFMNIPNMYFKDVMIYHKKVEDMNKTQQDIKE